MGEIDTREAWQRVASRRLSDYEELTEHDDYLIERYQDPSQAEYWPSSDSFSSPRVPAPRELVREVSRSYFRLEQHNIVAAWFEAEGFDLSKPTISKEEFEKRFADYFGEPAVARKISAVEIEDFVREYLKSTPHRTMDDCENKWKAQHGSSARELLRVKYHDIAKTLGVSVKEGRPEKLAK